MKKIIFTGDNLTDKERKEFFNQGFQIDAYDTNLSNAEIVDIVNRNQYDGYILGGDENLDSKTIAKFPDSMKVISFYGVGYEAYIDTIATTKKGIFVTNTPRTNTNAVSEHTIALILASTRNIAYNNDNFKAGLWQKEKLNDYIFDEKVFDGEKIKENLRKKIIGQDENIDILVETYKMKAMGLYSSDESSFFFGIL